MLEDMKDKGKKEMEAEQVQFGKFDQFCEMTLADKGRSISDAADKIETLEADIQQAISETERLTNEIAAHESDIQSATTEKTEATELREKERGEFQATLQDYTESIDAIGRALKALKEEDKKTSFVQLTAAKSLKLMPSDAVDSIDAYLNANRPSKPEPSLIMQGSGSESLKPEPKTYEFQSGAAITMLETLSDKFVEERNKLEQEEQAQCAAKRSRITEELLSHLRLMLLLSPSYLESEEMPNPDMGSSDTALAKRSHEDVEGALG